MDRLKEIEVSKEEKIEVLKYEPHIVQAIVLM